MIGRQDARGALQYTVGQAVDLLTDSGDTGDFLVVDIREPKQPAQTFEALDVDETIYARINAAYGTDYKLRR